MARVGSFSASQLVVGAPLNVIDPADNVVPEFDPEIEAMTGLTEAEKIELQQQVDELAATLASARDFRD